MGLRERLGREFMLVTARLRFCDIAEGENAIAYGLDRIGTGERDVSISRACLRRRRSEKNGVWTLLTKVETSCDRILIAGGANVEAEWEQGPAV